MRTPRRLGALLATLALAGGLAACGGSDDSDASGTSGTADGGGALVVSGATSLTQAFEGYGAAAGDPRFQFAGSDELAAQIQQGVTPDVFASANTTLPDDLYRRGLVERPVVFASNRLVIAVPASGSDVSSVSDLEQPGTTIAIGDETVPIGAYTRRVLAGLGKAASSAVLANVRSNEPDVGGVIGKVQQGAVDAGFVYATDAKAAGDKVRAVPLPARLQPDVAYAAAVVRGAEHPEEAQRFIDGLLRGEGEEDLRAAGFLPPPD